MTGNPNGCPLNVLTAHTARCGGGNPEGQAARRTVSGRLHTSAGIGELDEPVTRETVGIEGRNLRSRGKDWTGVCAYKV